MTEHDMQTTDDTNVPVRTRRKKPKPEVPEMRPSLATSDRPDAECSATALVTALATSVRPDVQPAIREGQRRRVRNIGQATKRDAAAHKIPDPMNAAAGGRGG